MARYKVVIGDAFEVEAVEVADSKSVAELADVANARQKARVQERLTYLIFGALLLALSIATLIGVVDGSYDEVGSVWSAAALPLGYVLGTYFEKKK